MCIVASVYINSSVEQHLLECWTSFFFFFFIRDAFALGERTYIETLIIHFRMYKLKREGSGVFKRVNKITSCFFFGVLLIKLLMHAVDDYLMACVSVTDWWHEPCRGHCMTGVC